MSLFKRNKPQNVESSSAGLLAKMALSNIHDGVIITDKSGVIKFANPAAISMTGCSGVENAVGLDYGLILKIESKEGREYTEADNPLTIAMKTGQGIENYIACLITCSDNKRIPIALSVMVDNGGDASRIVTFRNVTKELAEDSEQAEFISTASHEMRTPIASIEGYLSLTLNPQTATIDERARGYLTAAHNASQHLGRLFRDLLDATKLDDGHVHPHFEPVEMVGTIKQIIDGYTVAAKDAKLNFQFGSNRSKSVSEIRKLDQVVYGFVDVNFLREIMGNLIENAIKYTPAGGSIYVNVLGDGDRVLINVTDTGIGISSDDIHHIFQKFYRADNSDTRTVGGTGLGLYIVKQRVEAMGGKVWAESAFGEGSTFYVSLPRITGEEYEKRMIAYRNAALVQNSASQPAASVPSASQPVASIPGINQPVTNPQGVSQPIIGSQSASQPTASSSGASQPIFSQPIVNNPNVNNPNGGTI